MALWHVAAVFHVRVLARRCLVMALSSLVIGSTLLNLAFSLAPRAMTDMLRSLMA